MKILSEFSVCSDFLAEWKTGFTLCYSYFHFYLSYANLSWGSTNITNLKKLLSQQKHAARIISNSEDASINELFKSQNILNIYMLNILAVAVFIYQIRNKISPLTFSRKFERLCHGYPTNFSKSNHKIPKNQT